MTPNSKAFYGLIGIATFTKLLMNITRRLAYPFAPEFARGLNVDLAAVTSLIAINQGTSVLGPLGASFADRYGFKALMAGAVALLTVGTFAAGLIPMYAALMISLFLGGLAKNLFDPSLQAYIGSHIPFEHRGKVIGITEISWAGATLIGIPAAGLLIEKFSWQTPFWILGILSLACFFLLLRFMPRSTRQKNAQAHTRQYHPSMLANWKSIFKNPRVLGYIGYAFFMSFANDNLFVVYGAWLEHSYSLSLTAIGFGTVFIGLSEIIGEGGTALFSDRIGLKRAVITGTTLTAAGYFALCLLDTGLPWVLGGLFTVFLFYEFTYVTSMGLGTELLPELRASTMSAFYATAGIGRVIGAFSGGLIWTRYGISGISLVSGIGTLLALGSLVLGFWVSAAGSKARLPD